jgi:hypothetical protein
MSNQIKLEPYHYAIVDGNQVIIGSKVCALSVSLPKSEIVRLANLITTTECYELEERLLAVTKERDQLLNDLQWSNNT